MVLYGTLIIPNHSHDLNTSYNDIRVTSVIEDSLAI